MAARGRERVRLPVERFVLGGAAQRLLPVGLETRLLGWEEREAEVDMVTQRAPVRGVPSVHRTYGARVEVGRPGETLSDEAAYLPLPTREEVSEAFQRVDSRGLFATGEMEVHGHPALWQANRGEEASEQTLSAVWYCPVRSTRYLVRYRTLEGNPGQAGPLVAFVGENLRCLH